MEMTHATQRFDHGVCTAIVRDDGTVHVRMGNDQHEAPHAPRRLTQIAIDSEGVWVLDRKRRLFLWNGDLGSSHWSRIQPLPRVNAIFCHSDGRLCVLNNRNRVLIRNTDKADAASHDSNTHSWNAAPPDTDWIVPPRYSLPRVRARTLIAIVLLGAAILGPGRKWYTGYRRQLAIDAMRAHNVTVYYEHEFDAKGKRIHNADVPGERWLREIFGNQHFVTPIEISVGNGAKLDGHLRHLRTIRRAELKGHFDNLDELAQLHNLKELKIRKSTIDDLSALANIRTLEKFSISESQINGVPDLSPLTQLREISFYDTPVRDLRPFRNLPNLEILNLIGFDNLERSFSLGPIANLPRLREFSYDADDLRHLHPSVLHPLASLERLYAGRCEIKSLAWAAKMKSLEHVGLYAQYVRGKDRLDWSSELRYANVATASSDLILSYSDHPSFEGLKYAAKTKVVHLEYARIDNLDALSRLPAMTELDASNTQIQSFPYLDDPSRVRQIRAVGSQIDDVTALASYSNLGSLRLSGNPLSNASALASLEKLNLLDLANTKITNLDFVAKLRNIYTFDASHCDIESLAPFAESDSPLSNVTINHTRVSDLSPIGKGIKKLSVEGCPIRDISSLEFSTISELNLKDTQVADLKVLATLLHLKILNLANTPVATLAPLKETRITKLDLSGTDVVTIDEIQHLTRLGELSIGRVAVNDFSPISALHDLSTLDVSETTFDDSPMLVDSCQHMQRLSLARTPVTDIAPLARLKSLRFLNLSSTRVGDFSPLRKVTQLVELDVSDTEFSDCTILSADWGMDRSHRKRWGVWPVKLSASGSKISDISHLAKITQLSELYLAGNPIDSFEPLNDFLPYGLNVLDIRDCKISDLQPVSRLVGLLTLRIDCARAPNLGPLSKLRVLEELTLQNVQPTQDLSPIGKLKYLTTLELTGHLGDPNPLTSLPHLRHLQLPSGTQLPEGFVNAIPTLSSVLIGDTLVVEKGRVVE